MDPAKSPLIQFAKRCEKAAGSPAQVTLCIEPGHVLPPQGARTGRPCNEQPCISRVPHRNLAQGKPRVERDGGARAIVPLHLPWRHLSPAPARRSAGERDRHPERSRELGPGDGAGAKKHGSPGVAQVDYPWTQCRSSTGRRPGCAAPSFRGRFSRALPSSGSRSQTGLRSAPQGERRPGESGVGTAGATASLRRRSAVPRSPRPGRPRS